jgi:hypothetical protein
VSPYPVNGVLYAISGRKPSIKPIMPLEHVLHIFQKKQVRSEACFIPALKFIAQGPISTTEHY